MVTSQLNFDVLNEAVGTLSPQVSDAIAFLSHHGRTDERGAVYTRREVIDFILDLVGYTDDQPLFEKRLLEPAFGGGAFLIQAVGRLLATWRREYPRGSIVDGLGDSICAVELHRDTFVNTRMRVIAQLEEAGVDSVAAEALVDRWLIPGDFLLEPIKGPFDFIVGNPPYVRQELIPAPLLAEYRRRYQTLYDRADIYIPFFERSLGLLHEGASLGFICADRWMKNRYGGPLRNLVAEKFHLKIYVDMVNTPAFHSEVSAYPAITIISRESSGATRVAHQPAIDETTLRHLARELRDDHAPTDGSAVQALTRITHGAEPWLLGSVDQTTLLRRLEQQFPSLEAAGCKVGIGVATGADRVFIGEFATLDVEPDRKLRLVTTRDIVSGEVEWKGKGVINPYRDDGGLVNLRQYPKLRDYLESRKGVMAARHCAQKTPANWYRTIDAIYPALVGKPKLLIPDIKGEAHVVFERGEFYPHHNLYYIVSDTWDLRALQAVLMSEITRLCIATYSTRMRGGYLRFQAQYLRRIHVPHWRDVPGALRKTLIDAATSRDQTACNSAIFELYGLSAEERAALGGNGDGHGP